jgi:hypothetical protein
MRDLVSPLVQLPTRSDEIRLGIKVDPIVEHIEETAKHDSFNSFLAISDRRSRSKTPHNDAQIVTKPCVSNQNLHVVFRNLVHDQHESQIPLGCPSGFGRRG